MKQPTLEQAKAFIDAAENDKTAKVQQYIADGYDVNAKGEYGKTALMHAAKFSNGFSSLETVQLLIDACALNLSGRTIQTFSFALARFTTDENA